MSLKTTFLKFKESFGTKEMHHLILKSSETNLSAEELKVLNEWTNAEDYRKIIYKEYLEVVALQKKTENAGNGEIRTLLEELKKRYPNHFSDFPPDMSFPILKGTLAAYLATLAYTISKKLVFGRRVILIIAFVVRIMILIVLILILLKV